MWKKLAKPRKQGNNKTTISIRWDLKNRLRGFAYETKTTKVGKNYESDEQVLKKVLDAYEKDNEPGEVHDTYPTKPKIGGSSNWNVLK